MNYDDHAFKFVALSVLGIILSYLGLAKLSSWCCGSDAKKKRPDDASANRKDFTDCDYELYRTHQSKFANISASLREANNKKQPVKLLTVSNVLLVIAGIAFFALLLSASSTDGPSTGRPDAAKFDPYAVLEIDRDVDDSAIKQAYRKLSLKWHPDKNVGDEAAAEKFVQIAKAYELLSNEETRQRYEEEGDPDAGLSVSIGLPSWLINRANAGPILVVYALVVLVLPAALAIFWWRRVKNIDPDTEVHRETLEIQKGLLYTFTRLGTPPLTLLKWACTAMEYSEFARNVTNRNRDALAELQKRVSAYDSLKIPQHLSRIPWFGKAYLLLLGHLYRINPGGELIPETYTLLKTAGRVLAAMFGNSMSLSEYAAMHELRREKNMQYDEKAPEADKMVNTTLQILKARQHMVQAVAPGESPLLQLPHANEDVVRALEKANISNLSRALAAPVDKLEKALARALSRSEDDVARQLQDIQLVLSRMPQPVVSDISAEVIEEDSEEGPDGEEMVVLKHFLDIRPRDTVTLGVTLSRTGVLPNPLNSTWEKAGDWGDKIFVEGQEDEDEEGTEEKKKESPTGEEEEKNKSAETTDEQKKATAAAAAKSAAAELRQRKGGKKTASSSSSSSSAVSAAELGPRQYRKTIKVNDMEEDAKQRRKLVDSGELQGPVVHAPFYPDTVHENWWAVLVQTKPNRSPRIVGCQKLLPFQDHTRVEFKVVVGVAMQHEFEVHLVCDAYMGLDQTLAVSFPVVGSASSSDAAESSDPATLKKQQKKQKRAELRQRIRNSRTEGEDEEEEGAWEESDEEEEKEGGDGEDEEEEGEEEEEEEVEEFEADEDGQKKAKKETKKQQPKKTKKHGGKKKEKKEKKEQELPSRWYYLGGATFWEGLINVVTICVIGYLAYLFLDAKGYWGRYVSPVLNRVAVAISPVTSVVSPYISPVLTPVFTGIQAAFVWLGDKLHRPPPPPLKKKTTDEDGLDGEEEGEEEASRRGRRGRGSRRAGAGGRRGKPYGRR